MEAKLCIAVARAALFTATSAYCAYHDARRLCVPTAALVAPILPLALLSALADQHHALDAVVGIIGAIVIYGGAWAITRGRLGWGDVLFACAIGATGGFTLVAETTALACPATLILCLVTGRDKLPFIPALAAVSVTLQASSFFFGL
jgi:prepilin signal peptidase PulO-like enzyme (type II secretory pathway)